MRGTMAGLLVALLSWAPAWAQEAVPARPGEALLTQGWRRIDDYTLRRVDVATAAVLWRRVDAHRWQAIEAGEAPRQLASR